MQVEWVRIEGFRNYENETINLSNKTLIIGSNDVGKTNLIYALRILFDKLINIDITDSESLENLMPWSNQIPDNLKIKK